MELITVSTAKINGGAEINSVNARELHTYLESKQEFSTWIKNRIEKYDFKENDDFISFDKVIKRATGGTTVKEYIITLGMAKELAMVENTQKGKEVRKYFIEVEKKAKNPSFALPQNYIEALEALTKSEKEKLQLTETIKKKDEVICAVADLNIRAGDVSIGDFAKNLAIQGLGQNNLFAWLKARGFLMMDTTPYQPYVERGYFVRKPYQEKVNGEVRYKTMLTPKGTVWLAKILKAEYNIEE